jgi:glycosyltransferase involved in cell wall biosynthesis
MRMLVVSDQWFPTYRGGAARVATDAARYLAAAGHTVDVVAPSQLPEVAVTLRRGRLPQSATDVVTAALAARRLRDRDYDVVVAHQATVAVGAAAALPGVPLAYVFHASAAREARFDGERLGRSPRGVAQLLLEKPLAVLEQHALARAARILVLSEYSSGLASTAGARSPVDVVSGGVDTARFDEGDGRAAARARLGLSPDRPLLVAVRRLEPRMGLSELLAALQTIDADLVIGGTGTLASRLDAEATALGVRDRVRFAGRISDDALPDWYRAADAVVVPSLAYEGFGMVTAEALACGTPVVGTPVGATPELLAPLEPALLAAGTRPDELAAAVRATLALAPDALARRCRAYARQTFSWDVVGPRWAASLAAAAGPRPSAKRRWTFFERRVERGSLASPR